MWLHSFPLPCTQIFKDIYFLSKSLQGRGLGSDQDCAPAGRIGWPLYLSKVLPASGDGFFIYMQIVVLASRGMCRESCRYLHRVTVCLKKLIVTLFWFYDCKPEFTIPFLKYILQYGELCGVTGGFSTNSPVPREARTDICGYLKNLLIPSVVQSLGWSFAFAPPLQPLVAVDKLPENLKTIILKVNC